MPGIVRVSLPVELRDGQIVPLLTRAMEDAILAACAGMTPNDPSILVDRHPDADACLCGIAGALAALATLLPPAPDAVEPRRSHT